MTILAPRAGQDQKSFPRLDENPSLVPTLRFAPFRPSGGIVIQTRAGFSDPARLGVLELLHCYQYL